MIYISFSSVREKFQTTMSIARAYNA